MLKPETKMSTDQIIDKMKQNVAVGKVFYYTFSRKWKEGNNAFQQIGDFALDKKGNAVKLQRVTQNTYTKQELSNYAVDDEMYRYTRRAGNEQLFKIKKTSSNEIVRAMKDDIYQTISAAKACLESNKEIESKQGIFYFGEETCNNDVFERVPGKMSIEVNAETFDFTIRIQGDYDDSMEVGYDKDTDYLVTLPIDKSKAEDDEVSLTSEERV